jgi:tetratricopeptide (TPR) repeat protein
VAVAVVALAVAGALMLRDIRENRRAEAYAAATAAQAAGDCRAALASLTDLGDYRDAAVRAAQCQNQIDYAAARAQMKAGDFETALATLERLGDFEGAAGAAETCRRNIDFLAAQDLLAQGDPEAARQVFVELTDAGFAAAAEWVSECDYQLAEALLAEGKRHQAHEMFLSLGAYDDAAERAEQCRLELPASGVLWQAEGYKSTESSIRMDLTESIDPYYYKVYDGDTAIAALFVNAGAKVEVELPPGEYSIKKATGDAWWGETDLFGPDGAYARISFDDGTDWIDLASGKIIIVTVTYGASDGSNDAPESLEGF